MAWLYDAISNSSHFWHQLSRNKVTSDRGYIRNLIYSYYTLTARKYKL
jgi:hypothetical protein